MTTDHMQQDESNDKYNWIRRHAKKLKAIRLLGCNCKDCGRNLEQEPWAADFHHPVSEEKESVVSKLFYGSWTKVWKEVSKCQLLCSICHGKKHFLLDRYNQYKDEINDMVDNIVTKDPLTDAAVKHIQKLSEQGLSHRKIAKIVGCSTGSVAKFKSH